MSQAFLGANPGTRIADALAPELHDGVVDNTTTTGSWVEVPFNGEIAVQVVVGVADADLALGEVSIQGSDTGTGGGTNVVTYGRFADIQDDDDDETRYLQLRHYKRYLRAVIVATTGGFDSTITVVPAHTALGNSRTA